MSFQCSDAIKKLGADGNEKEIRFGKFIKGRFKPGVNKFTFNDIIEYFDILNEWSKSTIKDKVSIKTFSNTQSIRRIDKNSTTVFQLKEKLNIVDVPMQNYRVVSSNEKTSGALQMVYNNSKSPIFVRERQRTSFKFENLQLDLTQIGDTYEVELEFKNERNVCKFVEKIRSIIDKSVKKGGVMYEYRQLTKTSKFVGPLPQTLTKNDFSRRVLSKIPYAVTDKADGERYLLLIGRNGSISYISRKMDIVLTQRTVNTKYSNTLVDGELVGDKFYCFDILFISGRDVRKNSLKERLNKLNDIVSQVGIYIKKFYFNDIYKNSSEIWKTKGKFPYSLDGLIYTPINEEYYNRKIYKWKENNTIDFFYTGNRLQIAGFDKNNQYVNMDFTGIDGQGTFKPSPQRDIKNEIFITKNIPSSIRNGVLKINGPPGVGEFEFSDNTFKLIKKRPDKEFANGVDASNQSWEAIMSPLSIDEILVGPGAMRQFHNDIKTKLIKKYTPNKRVLDIGSGKGEDVRKYIDANTKEVVGFDLVDEEYPHPTTMKFFKVPDPVFRVKDYVSNTFDVININFAIHYFLRDRKLFESFLLNVHENLSRNGGILMATVLNGKLVYNTLKNKTNYKTNKFEFFKNYNNTLNFNSPKFKFLGQKVGVLVKGTKYFTSPIVEYLFNFEKFLRIMEEMGFELVETGNFRDFCDLETCKELLDSEKEYSFKNIYFILRRVS